jgi:hypothetical protein
LMGAIINECSPENAVCPEYLLDILSTKRSSDQ